MLLSKTSEKVIVWMYRNNISQIYLAKEMGTTRQTLASKLKDNIFTTGDIMTLTRLGCPL